MKRRGFFGKLATLLGLAALPVRSEVVAKAVKPEPTEIKKGIVTELPNGWVVTQYSYQRPRKGE